MEKFKKIDWKYVIIASIVMLIFTIYYIWITNQYSTFLQMFILCLSSFMFTPVLIIILAFTTSNEEKVRPQVHSTNYYITLTKFSKTDIVFYNEQLHQFTEDELDDYNIWLLKNYKNYNVKK